MGLRHSGELTDAALSSLAELHCASRHDVQRASGISHYSRYRDNVLILAEDKQLLFLFLGILLEQAKLFKFTVEHMVNDNMHYLNFCIYRQHGKLRVRPAFKGSVLSNFPLSSDSAHPPAVHRWPIGQIKSLCRLSSTMKYAMIANNIYIQRFKFHLAPNWLIEQMLSVKMASWRLGAITSQATRRGAAEASHEDDSRECDLHIWLPLPFHPSARVHVARAIAQFNSNPGYRLLYQQAFNTERIPKVRLAWMSQMKYIRDQLSIIENKILY